MNEDNQNISSVPAVQPKRFIPPQKGQQIFCEGTCYYIGDFIKSGGFGAAYRCTDEWSNNLVAKILLPQNRAYEQVRDEWLAELRNLSLLRHPNITYIYQAFEYRDTFYIIVEQCSYDLTSLIGKQNMDGNIWLPYIARDILHGLDFVHKNGYVHKDLHPGNIFVSHHHEFMVPTKDPVWSFKIGDLGISRLENDIRIFNTILAQWMVPPEYIDPSEFGKVGKHVDIYHAGLVLLGLILNRIPEFTRDEIIEGVPRKMAESLQSPYAPAIAKALRRHTVHRTQSALEMWRDIFAAMPKP